MRDQSSSIAIGPCDGDGNRSLRLVSVVSPSGPDDLVQWYIDGEPFGPAMKPGPYTGKVPGDGETHLIELKVISPADAKGDTAELVFPACEDQTVAARISGIDLGRVDDDGMVPIRLSGTVRPDETDARVQWLFDGQPLGPVVPVGSHVDKVEADGQSHEVRLEVVAPENGTPDTETIDLPEPPATATITSIEVGEVDTEGLVEVGLACETSRDDASVRWLFDDEPVVDRAGPGRELVKVRADGATHEIRLELLEGEGKGDSQTVELPERRAKATIAGIDLGKVTGEGMVPIRLISKAEPPETELQWYFDGAPIGPVVTQGAHVGEVQADGTSHQVRLEPINPKGDLDSATIDLPRPKVTGKIKVADFVPLEEEAGTALTPEKEVADIKAPGPVGPVGKASGEVRPPGDDKPKQNPELELNLGPVDINNDAMVGALVTGVEPATVEWLVDGVASGSSGAPGPHLLRIAADGASHRVLARLGDGTELSAKVNVPEPSRTLEQFQAEAELSADNVVAEFVESPRAVSLSPEVPMRPEMGEDVAPLVATRADRPDIVQAIVDNDLIKTGSYGPDESNHIDFCPTPACDDTPQLQKHKIAKTKTQSVEPLRNIIPVPCTHMPECPHGGHKKTWKATKWGPTVTIKLPCLSPEFPHDCDFRLVPKQAAGPLKSITAAGGHSGAFKSLVPGIAFPAHADWIRELLHKHDMPDTSGLKRNIYFVNGIFKGWGAADAQRAWIEEFLGADYRVRILHNGILESSLEVGTTNDAYQLHHDYRWCSGSDSQLRTKPLGSHSAVAVASVLLHAQDKGSEIGFVGSSGGTLQTFMGIRAFAARGSSAKKFLKEKVSLIHLGCLVHRNDYGWLDDHLRFYERHIDRRDPFARTFSGEVLPSDPEMQGQLVDHATMVNYVASDLSAASNLKFWGADIAEAVIVDKLQLVGPGPIQAAIGNASLQMLMEQGIYHSIASNYMGYHERHAKRDAFGSAGSTAKPPPVVKELEVGFKTARGSGTTNSIRISFKGAGGSHDHTAGGDGKFNGGAIDWVSMVPPASIESDQITGMTIKKFGHDNWTIERLTVRAVMSDGTTRELYHDKKKHQFGNYSLLTWTF